MSIRIHQLAKEIGLENKELLGLLQERGYEVKSVSSTIDNISAESLKEEFAKKAEAAAAAEAKALEKPKPVAPPAGVFVKTKDEIEREKKEAEEAAKKASAKEAPEPKAEPKAAPAPVATPAKAPMPAAPPSKPAPAAPPVGIKRNPAPVVPPVGVKKPAGEAPKIPAPGAVSPSPASPPKATVPPVGGPPKAAPPASAPAPASPKALSAPSVKVPPVTPPAKTGTPEEGVEAAEDAPTTKMRQVTMKPPVVLRDLADTLGVKSFRLIAEFMEMGIFASMNGAVEEDVAKRVAVKYGVQLEIRHRGDQQAQPAEKKVKISEDDERFLKPRPPVVCVLGHVDHGKTTLVDAIRQTTIVSGEAGGITQHIGAYKVKTSDDQTLTFIDTPGHAAFSAMREMGANVTDIAVLVVAADDGFMPQTDEALKFARKAQNAIVVAINKMDAPGANIDRVKTQMQERGIAPEDWGGETLCVPVSALKGEGIDALLEMIALQSEIMELKANPDAQPQGIIIESQIEQGKGATSTVIIEKGTLKRGDALIAGTAYCRVRTLTDDKGQQVKGAGPGTPVSITGWSDTPFVGGRFESQKNERAAKKLAEQRLHSMKIEASNAQKGDGEGGPATIDDLFAAIENQQKKCLRIIVKSDVSGSLAAIRQSLAEIKSDKVDLEIVSSSVGHVTKKDVTMASTSGATIFGFNTRIENGVQGQAKHNGINIYQHSIIYELLDLVTEAMTDLLEPEKREKKIGRVEVRQLFSMGRKGTVAGCMVIEGTVNRKAVARVLRKDEVIVQSKVDTLRRFKDDVSEVRAGYECGVHLFDFNDYEEGDIIEVFEIEHIRPKL